MLTLLRGSLIALFAFPVWSQETIRLNVAPGGFPPFTIITPGQEASGIVIDILRLVATKAGHEIQFMEIPRNRVERMVLQDELDATPRAIEWTQNPTQFVFTEPMLSVRDVIFSNKSTPLIYLQPQDLENKRIGTRLGYTYPTLDSVFSSRKVSRTDVTNERTVLLMLDAQRVDAVVLNEMTALWIIKNEGWQDKFVYSRQEVQSYAYRLMFNKKWAHFVQMFDNELFAMKKDGRLARIIQKYQPDRAVTQN
ncbi:MAG: transporter substrate-binding domain-containing protein [Rhodoferax sp.]|nr:transporter substrate-binding domain-containing protein [Rhodoferax sp.]